MGETILRCPTCGCDEKAFETSLPGLEHVTLLQCLDCGQQYTDGYYGSQEDKELEALEEQRD